MLMLMLMRIEQLISKYRKHKYIKLDEVYKPSNTVNMPVYVCIKCGKRLYLDYWQILNLPREIKYNCIGKEK